MPSTHHNAGIPASCFIDVRRNAKIVSFATALAFLQHDHGTTMRVGATSRVGKRADTVHLRVLAVDATGVPTEIGVVLYDTVILTYRNDETFTCNSGGFVTHTTCTRLNQFSPDGYRFGRGDRMLWCRSWYADENANRFTVAQPGVIGHVVKPRLKRKRAKGPHGTLRWFMDSEGMIYSTNDMRPDDFLGPVLDYEKIGKDGNYNAPLEYNLEFGRGNLYRLCDGLRGIEKTAVPIDVANAHREKWGMPVMELVA